jgi:polyketide synthase 5
MCWPHNAEITSNAEQLGNHLRGGGFTGVVILTGPKNGDAEDRSPLLGREYVQHLVRITRELPELPGEPPRLYVVTRTAQTVLAGDRPNLEQAGPRGLMRVIGTEHPHLR